MWRGIKNWRSEGRIKKCGGNKNPGNVLSRVPPQPSVSSGRGSRRSRRRRRKSGSRRSKRSRRTGRAGGAEEEQE